MKKIIIYSLAALTVVLTCILSCCGTNDSEELEALRSELAALKSTTESTTPTQMETTTIGEPTIETTLEETTEEATEPVVEENLLYLSKCDISVYPGFISCKETGTKAMIFSDLSTFVADMGIEYIKFTDMVSLGKNKSDNIMTISKRDGTPSYISSIHAYKNDKYTFGFNNNIFIGDTIDDVRKIYGQPNFTGSLHNSQISNSYHLEKLTLTVYYKYNYETQNMIVSEWSISTYSLPFLQCENYLTIYRVATDKPNSAGGVDVSIGYKNDNEKTIKYIDFHVTPYNAVDDVVSSDIGDKTLAGLQVTGPIETSDPNMIPKSSSWGNVWYNSTIKYAVLEYVHIIYMDGEEVILLVE